MFRITHLDQVAKEVRRIAGEQNSKAIDELDNDAISRAEKIHQVRKRCKKVRGVVRLIRPAFEEIYQTENQWFRDTASSLAQLRDVWPGPLQERVDEADRLGDLLGEDHDLAVLSQHIADSPDVFESGTTARVFQSLIRIQSDDLRSQSMAIGVRLLGESTSGFVHRIKTYWKGA